MNLASELQSIEPKVTTSPWSGYEHVRGYAVMMLPFSSGHLLGLRVWPQNDFAPYVSVWHCTPEGHWSIYIDGPSLKTTCPRYWGPALKHSKLTDINLAWTSQNKLQVEMKEPQLQWTMSMSEPSFLQKVNKISATLPRWTWKFSYLLRARKWMAKKFIDMGDIQFSFVTASGHNTIIMPKKMFLIKSSNAEWKGQTLGEIVKLDYNPSIGGVLLPNQPSFVVGEAHMGIINPDEYQRTKKRVHSEDKKSILPGSMKAKMGK